ncbi:MAG: ATP phosphoribosyltransferase regulatory subunit [Clostridia bacterium]|nr:ATP phosphoribosyltransferase regulatory subunit [Clostridia bacterium]
MNKYQNATPDGVRDILFEESSALTEIKSKVTKLFEDSGYAKIETPTMEFFDVFNRESCGIPFENMFKFTDRKGRLLVLRPDNTLAIARASASNFTDVNIPLKLYYSQKIFISKPEFSGAFNEELQCGIENFGFSDEDTDFEVLSLAIKSLSLLNDDFKLEIGNSAFFKALVKNLNVDKTKSEKIRLCVENKNFPALSEELKTVENSRAKEYILKLPTMFGGEELIDEAMCILPEDNQTSKELTCLKNLYRRLKEEGYEDKISFDLGLVHGINYYTGLVFRGYLTSSGLKVLSGGRYDKLLSEFGKDLSAIGFALEMNTISDALLRRKNV